MASTYSTKLRFELPTNGELSGTWGTTTNTNVGTLLEQAIAGHAVVSFPTDANITLSTANGSSDEARNASIRFTSVGSLTATRDAIVPTQTKLYLIHNNTTGSQSVRVKTSAGSGITIPNGAKQWVVCDGTNVVDGMTNLVSGTTLAGVAFGTLATLSTVGTATITDANVTYAKIQNVGALSVFGRSANSAGVGADITGTDGQILRVSGTTLGFGTIVAAGIASDAITTVKILNGNVTLAKMADMATNSILGRATAATGVPEVLTALPWAFTGDVTSVADANALTIAAGVVTYAKVATAAIATTAQLQAGTASTLVDSATVITAGNVETVSYAASVALDFTTFVNAKITLTGNLTLSNPTTTGMNGRSGVLELVQDGTGTRTITWGANYRFGGGTDIVLSTAANSIDLIGYYILSDGTVFVSAQKDAKN